MTDTLPRVTAQTPVPAGRTRWRFTLHHRPFSNLSTPWTQTMIAELPDLRGRRLEQAWNTPAQLTFTIDGHAPAAALIQELATEVTAWRWDETAGSDIPMFRGPVDHSEDQLSEQSHTVTFVAHDYLALMSRRMVTAGNQSGPGGAWNIVGMDQDSIVGVFVNNARQQSNGAGASMQPGSYLPVAAVTVNPDGSARAAPSGQARDRAYFGSQIFSEAIDNLARVINGFDYDIKALYDPNYDALRIFYPAQGTARSDLALQYGSSVSTLTRTVSSADYANYVRVLGNNGASDPAAAQLFAEAQNGDAVSGQAGAVGLWMTSDNAPDVNQAATLTQKAQGDLSYYGLLVPSYTATLRPGFYRYGSPDMGDTVPLIIRSGRLNVNTTIRVLGISYDLSDDGAEDVALTLGRPATELYDLFTRTDRAVDALTRR